MEPIPVRIALNAALFLATIAVWALPTRLDAQAPDLTQRQARIERAINTTEQIIGQFSAQSGGQRLARSGLPPNPCLASDAAWRSCLRDIQRDAALVTDPAYAQRSQNQLAFLIGRSSSLQRGDVGQDIRALQDVLAALQDEKQKMMQQINQQGRARRPTP